MSHEDDPDDCRLPSLDGRLLFGRLSKLLDISIETIHSRGVDQKGIEYLGDDPRRVDRVRERLAVVDESGMPVTAQFDHLIAFWAEANKLEPLRDNAPKRQHTEPPNRLYDLIDRGAYVFALADSPEARFEGRTWPELIDELLGYVREAGRENSPFSDLLSQVWSAYEHIVAYEYESPPERPNGHAEREQKRRDSDDPDIDRGL